MDDRPLDLVLVGGTVIDGSADAQPLVADVGVRGDTVVAIGDLREKAANRRLDVTGLVVAPGFIDPHTHVEIALTGETDDAHAPAAQGVTTILTSPDGFGWLKFRAYVDSDWRKITAASAFAAAMATPSFNRPTIATGPIPARS